MDNVRPRRYLEQLCFPITFAMLMFVLGGCQDHGGGPRCQEWIYIDWYDTNHPDKLPRSEFGELHCNGTCKDGSQCKPQSQNLAIPGDGLIKKEWCGCPDDPNEPAHCHGVRETYRSGAKLIVRFNCHGDCPVAVPGERCRELHRQTDAPAGVDKRYVAQCECLGPEANK